MLIGVRAEQFDDVAFAQTFILQPLIFLGGVFYSAALLPEPFETLTHFNPIYYMINLVRYGFVGYTEVSIAALAAGADRGDRGALRRQPAPLLAAATSCARSRRGSSARVGDRDGGFGVPSSGKTRIAPSPVA